MAAAAAAGGLIVLGIARDGPRGPGDDASRETVERTHADASGIDGEEREAWAVLASVEGVGPVTFARLLDEFGTAGSVLATATERTSSGSALARAVDARTGRRLVSDDTAAAIAGLARDRASLLASIDHAGVAVVTPHDPAYPRRVRAIELPPPVLFVRGTTVALDARPAIAVVGTRRPTEGGRRLAGRIVAAVADADAAIVSGLALGIDGSAHAAAVGVGAPTIAVIGGGHGHLYPRGHRSLAERIVARGGAILSEHPPDRPPTRGTFPRRNRVISGMADAVVVIEAGARSGALTTAAWALEQGRPLFLTPGSIDTPQVAGSLAFLREFAGEARVVAGIPELVEDLAALRIVQIRDGTGSEPATRRAELAELRGAERSVIAAMASGATSIDELVAATRLPPAAVLSTLTILEVRGMIEPVFGRYRLAGRLAGLAPDHARPAARTVRRRVRAAVDPAA